MTQRGVTLLELLVVLVVIGIGGSLAAPSMSRFVEQQQVRGALDLVLSDLHFAKMLAVRSGERVRFEFQSRPEAPGCRRRAYRIVVEGEAPMVARHRDLGEIADRGCLATGANVLRIGPRGLPVGLSNQTISLTAGSAAGSVVMSSMGRIRRSY
jgi:prepilin-type N-terminal cleavage/methylation domain-containing protein